MQLMWHNSCEEKTSNDTENRPWKSENRDRADRAACETGSSGHGADGQKDELSDSAPIAKQLSCGHADAAAAKDVFHPSVISLNCLRWELIRSGPSASVVPFVLLNVLLKGSFLLSLRK